MSNINKINGLDIDAASAQYVAAGNVDGPLGYNSVEFSNTASYIDPAFISASAAASGFGSGGGGSATASVALSASVSQATSITGYRVVLADTDGGGEGTYNTALYYDHNGIIYDASTNKLTVGQLSATGLTGSFAGTITNATSASYAATASYSTTLGAEITNPVVGMLRLRNSNSTTISTISDLTASLAASASYVNQLNQNVTINGNLTVFGTASYSYISASQLDVGTNTISVNVAEPAERFGGLIVYDSGSLSHQATASFLWDSLNNKWIYQNVSGSGYDGGMAIFGPRNLNGLGNEQGTTNNALMKGQGGDHITSSRIFDDGTNVYTNSNVQITGSLTVTGNVIATASWANNAIAAQSSSINFQTNAGLYPLVYVNGTGNQPLNISPYGALYNTITNAISSISSITASNGFQGTASYAVQALTASYAMNGGGSGPESDPIFTAWSGSAASYFAGTASYALSSAGVAGGVTSITAGDGISVDQSTGAVTITNTGGGGGTNLGLVYAVSIGYLMP